MKKKYKNKYGSLLTGIILGYLVGFFINLILSTYSNSIGEAYFWHILYFATPISFFAYLSTRKPKFVEYSAYAIAIFIILQWVWDFSVGDRNSIRTSLLIGAVISLVINIFTGKVKLIGAKKTFRRAIGLN